MGLHSPGPPIMPQPHPAAFSPGQRGPCLTFSLKSMTGKPENEGCFESQFLSPPQQEWQESIVHCVGERGGKTRALALLS